MQRYSNKKQKYLIEPADKMYFTQFLAYKKHFLVLKLYL